MKFKKSIFIFHRDIRLSDNKGLNKCLSNSHNIIPIFIFDPRQLENNPYRGDNSLNFMINSLKELDDNLRELGSKLHIFYGHPNEICDILIKEWEIEAIFENRDYTPFAQKRQTDMENLCKKYQIYYELSPDVLANEPEDIFNKKGDFFRVYTHFYNHCKKIPFDKMDEPSHEEFQGRFIRIDSTIEKGRNFPEEISKKIKTSPKLSENGGRKNGLRLLSEIVKLKDYEKERDYPYLNKTSRLSAHLKFGTISIREFYRKIVDTLGNDHPLIRQIYWRDFFYHIAFHSPRVFGGAFIERYDAIKWDNREDYFEKWQRGETGFPIVDAGMRELNETGFMHNRVRMITASFLVKDLMIDWRWGERYFANLLTDYDPCVNNGNWQWCASTGCDAQPFFRIFNPWRQSEKFDPNCEYIKKWLPELGKLQPKIIHNWHKYHIDYKDKYYSPIVNHDEMVKKIKDIYPRGTF